MWRWTWVVIAVGCGDDGGSKAVDARPADAADAAPDACVPSTAAPYVIFLNKGGGAYTKGAMDDATMNVSSIISADVTLPAPTIMAADWTNLVACVTAKFAPFNVTITETDPGTADHTELLVLDNPQQVGLSSGVGSVSPYGCANGTGRFTHKAIPMIFWSAGGATEGCWLAAQTLGSSVGLDHALSCPDIMTFLASCGPSTNKTFTDKDVSCGEDTARNCQCGGATQNSARFLRQQLGTTCM